MSTRGDPRPEKRKIDLFCGESNPDIIPEIRYKGPPLVAPASAAAENLSLHKCDHGTPGPGSHSIVSACVVPTYPMREQPVFARFGCHKSLREAG
ncbi:unnamed protein product [Lasius platythorax]|uniref:Uncharacterized protein n=1 Tax=Lasius platythorax TaxID=488582 RepID=A0AAV2N6E9_9HYME